MSSTELKRHLEELRAQLDRDPPLSEEERDAIVSVMDDIEVQLAYQNGQPPTENLVDGVNLAVERFEVSHPRIADTLRGVMQTLVSIGV
jgi:hypothetical protein